MKSRHQDASFLTITIVLMGSIPIQWNLVNIIEELHSNNVNDG